MSASSNWVTRGVVSQLSAIRRAMTSRSGERGAFEIGPHLEKSTCSGAGLGPGAPASAAPRGAVASRCSFWMYARTSSSMIRPPRPLPRTRVRSMPKSRASLRIDGAAAGAVPGFPSESVSDSSSSEATGNCSGEGVWTSLSRFLTGAGSGLAAGGDPAAPLSPNERMRCPTLILSPVFTKIWVIVPAAVDGMVATAFSFSNSRMGWSFATVSPSLTKRLTTVPESAPSHTLVRSNLPENRLTASEIKRHRLASPPADSRGRRPCRLAMGRNRPFAARGRE